MAGYIGSKASVVSSGAERKKTFAITTSTTALTGLVYTPTKVHVFHNGVRLVDGTDFTATNGTSITLTVAAESGDQVVVVSYATFQVADAYTQTEADAEFVAKAGDTMTGPLSVTGTVTADSLTMDTGGVALLKTATDDNIRISQQTHASIQAVNDAANAFTELKLDGSTLLLNSQSNGNVGINTSSPDSYYAKKLVVDCGTDGQNGITIKSSTTGAGMFAFADGTSGSDRYRGYINYNHANDSMTLGTAGGAGTVSVSSTGVISGDGSGLTGVGASTTFGAVGTHIWGRQANITNYNLNVTASSLFAITSIIDSYGGQGFYDNGWQQSPNQTSVSGTWRHLGGAGAANGRGMPGLWVRIA